MLAEREFTPLYDIEANLGKIPLVDLNPNSEDFFGTYGVPRSLNLGKNRIPVVLNRNNLVEGATIYLQAIDSNGFNIPFIATDKLDVDGSRLLTVEVTKDTAPGPATLYIASRAKYHPNTGNSISYSADPASSDYKGIVNIVWKTTLLIKKEISEVPPLYSDYPTLEAYEMYKNYMDITGSRQMVVSTTASFTYHHVDNFSNYTGDYNEISTLPTNVIEEIPVVKSGITTTGTGSSVIPEDRLPVLQSDSFNFTKDMESGIVEIYTTFEGNRPSDASTSTDFINSNKKRFVISRVVSDSIAQIANPSRTSVTYTNTAGTTSTVKLGTFTSTSASFTYNADPTLPINTLSLVQKQKVVNFLRVFLANIDPINGVLKYVRISAKPVGTSNPFTTLGTYDIYPQELLTDSSSYQYESLFGLMSKEVGDIRSETELNRYYETYEYSVEQGSNRYEKTTTESSNSYQYVNYNLLNSVEISQSLNSGTYLRSLEVLDDYVGTGIKTSEYVLKFNAYVSDSMGQDTKAYIYISGSRVKVPPLQSSTYIPNIHTTTFGTRIGLLSSKKETRLLDNKFYFSVEESNKKVKPIIVIDSGKWQFSDIHLLTSDRNGKSPNHFTLDVPLDNLPVQKANTEYVFKVNYLGKNERPGNASSLLSGLKLNTRSNIDEDLISKTFQTSNLIQTTISGAFESISSSMADSITELNYLTGSIVSMLTSSFTNTGSHTFVHSMSYAYPVVQVYDLEDELFWPQTIQAVDENTIKISFSNLESGYVVVLAS